MGVSELIKKGFKNVYIIRNGLEDMKRVGFIWNRGGDLFQAGPDGKLRKIN